MINRGGVLYPTVDACLFACRRAFPWLLPRNLCALVACQMLAPRTSVAARMQWHGLDTTGCFVRSFLHKE